MFPSRITNLYNLVNKLNNQRVVIRLINQVSYDTKLPTLVKSTAAFNPNLQICRHKHKKTNKPDLTESDDEQEQDDWENEVVDKQTKVLALRVNSLRADVVLKAGLGIARNKIENMFYESKIRVNGQKLLKKSAMLSVGDEIDIVRGTSPSNPDFLTVSRVEILSAAERNEGLTVKVRRNKALTIENYEDDSHKN